jgi:hypothetical protein
MDGPYPYITSLRKNACIAMDGSPPESSLPKIEGNSPLLPKQRETFSSPIPPSHSNKKRESHKKVVQVVELDPDYILARQLQLEFCRRSERPRNKTHTGN